VPLPPGTSKWNRIEHRLFAHISMNWRGRPLVSHETIVDLIGATTTRTGLTVHAELDQGSYPLGVNVPDKDLAAVPLQRHDWHGDWNYTPANPLNSREISSRALRACASRRSRAAAGAAVPAVAGPGATQQPAKNDEGAGERQPERHDQPAALGAPAQLAILVPPGVGTFDHPAPAGLDRGWQTPRGDLGDHPALGQDLPAGLQS
jgi:Rhodopirellula transposase DDE domain